MALRLFEAFGIELEYMIVDKRTLDVRPVADELIRLETGRITSDVERGPIAWSNELAAHVIELKTNGPARDLAEAASHFQSDVAHMSGLLDSLDARLLPTAMHPWMDPLRETKLWSHEYNAVYEAFDRVFDCRGHGWANVQSMHVNLPFSGDAEFGRLHAAVRLLLPILPALAASSPVVDGQAGAARDTRLAHYRKNCARIPSVTGRVIPEPVFTRAEYETGILQPMYRDIAPLDPDGLLQDEYLNARGAIARFDRDAIEIRLLDMQEHPGADLAIARLVVAALRSLVDETFTGARAQREWTIDALEPILLACIRDAEAAVIDDGAYLRLWGLRDEATTAGEIWRHVASVVGMADDPAIGVILEQGTLATRIVRAIGHPHGRAALAATYTRLGECLRKGESFNVSLAAPNP